MRFRTIVRSLGVCAPRDDKNGKRANRKVVLDFHFGGTRKAGIVRGIQRRRIEIVLTWI